MPGWLRGGAAAAFAAVCCAAAAPEEERGCRATLSVALRKAAYCAKALESSLKGDVLCDEGRGMRPDPAAAPQWGHQDLVSLVRSLWQSEYPECREPPGDPEHAGELFGSLKTVDADAVKGTDAQGVAHPLELRYHLEHPVALHGSSWEPRRRCWDILSPSSLWGCTHRIARCINGSEMRTADPPDGCPPQPPGAVLVAERQLGGACPSYAQLFKALPAALPRERSALRKEFLEDIYEDGYVAVVGDSITKGSLSVSPFVDKGRRRWWWLALQWAAAATGNISHLPQGLPRVCTAARDGMSITKMRLDMEGKGISRFYKVRESPKKLVSRCFQDYRPGRSPTFAIVVMGTNDFLDAGDIPTFERQLQWLLAAMQRWSRDSIRGLMLMTHPFPAVGRREEVRGGHYWWRPHARAALLRVAEWARSQKLYRYVLTPELATSLQWCEEHNFADGIHPNPRGHVLMALEALRHLTRPPRDEGAS
eukprot:TRINITY_DN60412_c0_g1_i1.p2 TRINITY_DN60412_c0_g1~~TRINITY_DN60412_c0_g1_i1.p2  ORF type:complete len:480 (+),score=156.92 TRINITY_DN60412_c0_g1_i1:80-1519(+)